MTPMDWMDQVYEHFAVPVSPYVGAGAIALALTVGVVLVALAKRSESRAR
jgi:hypothetical protein